MFSKLNEGLKGSQILGIVKDKKKNRGNKSDKAKTKKKKEECKK